MTQIKFWGWVGIKRLYTKTVLIIALPLLIAEYLVKEAYRSFVINTQFKLAIRQGFYRWKKWWKANNDR